MGIWWTIAYCRDCDEVWVIRGFKRSVSHSCGKIVQRATDGSRSLQYRRSEPTDEEFRRLALQARIPYAHLVDAEGWSVFD